MPLKTCPACAAKVGLRTITCQCGHAFVKGARLPKPRENTICESRRSFLVGGAITAPAGEPPVKLRSMDEVDLLDWAHKTRDHYEQMNKQISKDGLLYYVQHYYCNSLDHPRKYREAEKLFDSHFGS